jgi:S1-C subfamily serine protease
MAGLLSATIVLVNYNISQTAQRSKELAIKNVNILLQAQQKFSLPEGTSYTPSKLDENTLVSVIAKNQPSVVRIATIYCADITLTSSRVVANFIDMCTAHVGSGSFISSDGYIATSGHVVSVSPKKALVEAASNSTESLNRYLAYMVLSRLLAQSRANSIKLGIASDNIESQNALIGTADLIPSSQLSIDNITTKYAIQLSNQPISLDTSASRITPNYTDTVINADYVDEDYDQISSDQGLVTGQFASSDVALLKATGSVPYITLGTVDDLKTGDQLTAIGFPAELDGVDSELTQTVPSITQGIIKSIGFDSIANERKIISTTVPIGRGNSGGPALNDEGEQVGLNTYSTIECPDLKCYGDGEVRDIADLKALIAKNNIILKTGSIQDDWAKALSSYTKGNYSDALGYLTKVRDEYPANYLVGSLLNVAEQQVGSATDTSSAYKTQGFVEIALIILVTSIVVITIVMVGLIIAFTIHFHIKSWRTDNSSENA